MNKDKSTRKNERNNNNKTNANNIKKKYKNRHSDD